MKATNKRNSDIIKNAALSFRAEGYSVPASVKKQAQNILSGKHCANDVISKHIKSYSKDGGK
jgi:predicted DNA-binding protein (UPF0278 family)